MICLGTVQMEISVGELAIVFVSKGYFLWFSHCSIALEIYFGQVTRNSW